MSSGPQREGAPLVALLGATGVVLVLLLGVWAATAGPDDAFRSDGPDPDRITTSAPTAPPSTSAPAPPAADDDGALDDSDAGWLAVVLGGVIFLAAALVVLAAVALAQSGLRRLRAPAPAPAPRDRRPDDDPDLTVVDAVTRDADVQREILATGGTTPRNAIVECWHRFEVQADRAGIPREPWETSSEFTLRLLDLAGADGHAVARLAELYREARFSEHEVGEEHRVAALEALRRIHQGPRAAVRAAGGGVQP
ncbi:DUF4129 domain-containing protein [Nocardioides sp. 1609]|uniref:DUF4129 domain-containing protein n=1 Tax=Nocardioides sp. 1609 TaxID=2508327 RepID=UPI00106FEA8D|nr:DUF4129 domain-containing protein [Nocardioides sp. 1609]